MNRFIIAVFVSIALVSACSSVPRDVPEDLTPNKIIQRAQEASDRNRFKLALGYYEILAERHSYDVELALTAEYEIAFIHYKQKKYDMAKGEFQTLLDRYKRQDAELLPPKYKILSERVMARIEEIQTKTKVPS